MHLIQLAVGAGQHSELVTYPLPGGVDVGDVCKRVELQRAAIEVDPAHVFAKALVAIAHVKYPHEATGVEHTA